MADTLELSPKFVKHALMGVLNVTPDSFFDGGRCVNVQAAVERGCQLAHDGADVIDVGGESTRPFSQEVSVEEELRRVVPVIRELQKHVHCAISIDTTKPVVAEAALDVGASFVNDVSGLRSGAMRALVAERSVPVCLMHMPGTPQTMQMNTHYPLGVVEEVLDFFKQRIEEVVSAGVSPSQIIVDPGIGFGKTAEQSCELLGAVPRFKALGFPVLVGASRKALFGKILGLKVEDRLSATLVAHTIALIGGADFLRVHDVKEHRDALRLVTQINAGPASDGWMSLGFSSHSLKSAYSPLSSTIS